MPRVRIRCKSARHPDPKPPESLEIAIGIRIAKKNSNFIPEPMNHEHCIKVCNSLLRGELSAVEAYDQAISKHADNTGASELHRIRDEHATAVSRLRENVREMGGTPEADSGAWGLFAKTIQSAANLFGRGSALESLQQGEEQGRRDYESALKDEEVLPGCKVLIRDELLPGTQRHIATLERLERAA